MTCFSCKWFVYSSIGGICFNPDSMEYMKKKHHSETCDCYLAKVKFENKVSKQSKKR
jgi:hypothetical protein